MRAMISAMILAAALGLGSAPGTVAAPIGVDVRGSGLPENLVEHVQYWRGRYCERLRRACL